MGKACVAEIFLCDYGILLQSFNTFLRILYVIYLEQANIIYTLKNNHWGMSILLLEVFFPTPLDAYLEIHFTYR